ncbi:MAG: lactaldehyde reductase [Candidatus Dactylopiibacterium carminicum]|uniref:Lactaldehyde reductase n=1 Tax=Candidatus Dactylopiibacterium carminicum TaxID=857335 RepID=A0A272ESU7_9RHOO|nr:lactaldehyde reductase [Candidatus Dactylopiibacterium carminicum]KAF7600740.1 lactaldehyde reductase [Candidatus Dactylopiibacterium carminicum]PAS93191.1 MAG: lactaldehyde reductase [Candidatus Dactylopiibacterium carminicum]PAS95850.1 MAG: lactaldehyde reductase [Candidatus Dactylopiibacterium carminicum]PAT00747.1 MAG: lactaldehyde reductase [Candidatus Dactylopiibacterium carminicum]
MASRIVLNETSYFGAGSVGVIAEEVARRGYRHALLVTDKGLVGVGPVERVEAVLQKGGIPFTRYTDVKPNPTIENVQQGVAACRAAKADFLIAVGGGSAIDTAKAIGIVITNPAFEDIRSLEGLSPTKKPCLPVIAIPTTAGTAAEVTINYVVTDVENRRKFVCVDPHDIPVLAIVDAELMASMPRSLAAATGMDALTHAIEGYITRGAWEMSDMFTLKAIELIAANLRGSVLDEAPAAREKMGLAQYIAGMGFSNVGLGLVHGMAHPLGAFYDTPHGVANALLLPTVMEFNAPASGEKYRDIARAMGVSDTEAMSQAQYREAACKAVRQLALDVGIPQHLAEIGAREADLPALANAAYRDVCTPGNPRDVSEAEILALYRKLF